MVAPAYSEDSYVDHVLSANLDLTYAFEGPEKLLEVWFWPDAHKLPLSVCSEGLRAIPLERWVQILDLVSCKILSMKSSPGVDAYLLSELSLFVFPHKMILKTCGTTTTLAALDEMFETAQQYCGAGKDGAISSENVFKVFYSRRSFMFPDRQKHVHTSWKHEVELLNRYFVQGKLYVVGDFTLDDHWYLYMGGSGAKNDTKRSRPGHDLTFEILMTELDPKLAASFVTARQPGPDSMADEDHDLGHDDGWATMHATGLDALFVEAGSGSGPVSGSHESPEETDENGEGEIFEKPEIREGAGPDSRASRGHEMRVHMPSPLLTDSMELSDDDFGTSIEFVHDAFAFTPCGYSSNSVSTCDGGYYYTLHITPESGWSYASFETNFPFSDSVGIVDVLKRVLRIFRPGRFSMTLISEAAGQLVLGVAHHESFAQLAHSDDALAKLGYKKHERVIYDLKSEYNLLYMHFERQ